MGAIIAVLVIAGIFWAAISYNKFKLRGFRPRAVKTTLSPDAVRLIFQQKVTGVGWSIVDDGNPMIAQSGLLAGIRQQIALAVQSDGEGSQCRIFVARYSKKVLGGTTKAYTLRLRMNAFLSEVSRQDPAAAITG